MSILARINSHESEGRLIGHQCEVIALQEGHPRQLWLTREAYDWCNPRGKHPDKVTEAALAMARNQLDHFVLGKTMFEDEDLKHLKPHTREVWTIRTMLDPRVRLFGWFVRPRAFIVVHGKRRDQLEPNGDGPSWERAIQKVQRIRTELFAGFVPYTGNTFSDYVD